MFTMGTDFQYQYATTWFRPMDKLIHYLNMVTFVHYHLYKEIFVQYLVCVV